MNKHSYGTKEYFEFKLETAKTRRELTREATSARLIAGKILPDDFEMYAAIMKDDDFFVNSAEKDCKNENIKA